jgi:hypothetical protein
MAIARSITSTCPKTLTALADVRGDRAGWKEAMTMPAKYKGPYSFTDRQVQEYNRTLRRLRNLHGNAGDAVGELRKIGRSNLTNKRYTDAGDFFAKVAAQMTSALQFLMAIRSSAQQLPRTRVEFVVSPVCGKCRASPYEREESPGVEAPPLDPAPYAELEDLLEKVNGIIEQLWSSNTGRKTLPAALTRGLTRLENVVVKQLRYFRETAPAASASVDCVVYTGNDCSKCHGPLTIPAADGRDEE